MTDPQDHHDHHVLSPLPVGVPEVLGAAILVVSMPVIVAANIIFNIFLVRRFLNRNCQSVHILLMIARKGSQGVWGA